MFVFAWRPRHGCLSEDITTLSHKELLGLMLRLRQVHAALHAEALPANAVFLRNCRSSKAKLLHSQERTLVTMVLSVPCLHDPLLVALAICDQWTTREQNFGQASKPWRKQASQCRYP